MKAALGSPDTTSEGIHDTLVTDDSIRIATPLPRQDAVASYRPRPATSIMWGRAGPVPARTTRSRRRYGAVGYDGATGGHARQRTAGEPPARPEAELSGPFPRSPAPPHTAR